MRKRTNSINHSRISSCHLGRPFGQFGGRSKNFCAMLLRQQTDNAEQFIILDSYK